MPPVFLFENCKNIKCSVSLNLATIIYLHILCVQHSIRPTVYPRCGVASHLLLRKCCSYDQISPNGVFHHLPADACFEFVLPAVLLTVWRSGSCVPTDGVVWGGSVDLMRVYVQTSCSAFVVCVLGRGCCWHFDAYAVC